MKVLFHMCARILKWIEPENVSRGHWKSRQRAEPSKQSCNIPTDPSPTTPDYKIIYSRKEFLILSTVLVRTHQCERLPSLRCRNSWSDFSYWVFRNKVFFGLQMRAHLSAALFTDKRLTQYWHLSMTSGSIWWVFVCTLRFSVCGGWSRASCRGLISDWGSQLVGGWPSTCRALGYNSHFLLISSYGHRMFREAEPKVWRDCPAFDTCYHTRQ